MKLIGAGLPRTGTLSQKVALEMLGLQPCYHMVNVLMNLDLAPRWRDALEGDADWEQIFDGFEATVDWPGSFFTKELIEVYPDAKVLLSVRDGHSWAKSMRDTIWGLFYDNVLIRHLSDARATIDPKWDGYLDMMREFWRQSGLIQGEETTAEYMANAMDRYHEEIKQTVPADRLLVWSVAEGWEPLCEFLEVPVPDTPFPHLNDSKEFGKRIIEGSMLAVQNYLAETSEDPVQSAS
jgi:Sulfotransferase domain